jgi:hypothetical protein
MPHRGFFSGVRATSKTALPFLLRQPIIDFSAGSCGRVLSSPIELGYSGLTIGLVGVVDVQGPFVSAEAGSNLILDPFMGHGVGQPRGVEWMDTRLDAAVLAGLSKLFDMVPNSHGPDRQHSQQLTFAAFMQRLPTKSPFCKIKRQKPQPRQD